MATRYRRINLDGKHMSETKIGDNSFIPGFVVYLNEDEQFSIVLEDTGMQKYVVEAGYQQGLTASEPIPVGDSVQAEYFSTNRELAIIVEGGSFRKDTGIKIVNGQGSIAGEGDTVVAYSQETVDLESGQLLRVRVA